LNTGGALPGLAVPTGCTGIPAASAQTSKVAAWRNKPSWYILSANDRVVSPSLQWAVAKRMDARVMTLQSGHMSLLSHANAVSKIILEAAAHAAGKTAN
jgi:hypothetical protein